MENRERLYREYREDGVLLLSASVDRSPIDEKSAERDLAFLEERLFACLRDGFLRSDDPRKYIKTKPHHVRIVYGAVENGGECLSFLRTVTLFHGGKRLFMQETPFTVDMKKCRALPPSRFLSRRILRRERKRIQGYTGFLVYPERLVFYLERGAPIAVKREKAEIP